MRSGLRYLVFAAALSQSAAAQSSPGAYVGSKVCANCHAATFSRWQRTRMANVVQDPRVHPEAIIPDLSKPDPLLTFTKDDIALTYGSKWKQRYFKQVGDDYFVLPAQWDITRIPITRRVALEASASLVTCQELHKQ